MINPHSPPPLRESDCEAISDYKTIAAAVMETEKGRWFLAEFARRNRAADTEAVLGAIAHLERALKRERRPDADRIKLDIAEMKDAIERTKLEIAQIKHDDFDRSRFDRASNELDAIVTQTEAATSDILGAAEKFQEIAWTLRENGIDSEACDAIEALVMGVYTACSFQDLTGQRIQKVVHVLRYLESRIDAMIEIWGMEEAEITARGAAEPEPRLFDERPDAHLLNGPALAGEGVDQSRVDGLMKAPDAPEPCGGDVSLSNEAIDDIAFEPVEAGSGDADRETVPPTPSQAPDIAAEDVLQQAAAAMDQAIETLNKVSASVKMPQAEEEDPLQRLSRAERLALFS